MTSLESLWGAAYAASLANGKTSRTAAVLADRACADFLAAHPDYSATKTVPLYRLQGHGDHFYTISPEERDSAIADFGYTYEGIACYVHADAT